MDAGERTARALDSLSDRLGVTPATVVIGALAVAGAVLAGWWAWHTPDPPPVEAVLPRVGDVSGPAASGPAASGGVPSTTAAPATIVVHVAGAVQRPGVHELVADARVVDALAAAGGVTAEADTARLNLAAPVRDGQRVWVPRVGEDPPPVVGPVSVGGGGSDASDPPAVVDLNQADATTLQTLPGVGPTIAAAIITHRERSGPFTRVEDLLEVPGIGPSRLAQLEPLVAV